jgi:hypothetical protein
MTVSDLLFDTPWWLPTIIIAVGLFVFLSGNKRSLTRVRNVGLAVVGAGLLLIAVSYLVDTDKEIVIARSKELVKDVEGREWDKAKALMAPDVRFDGYGRDYEGRDLLIDGGRVAVEEAGLNSATVTKVTPTVVGPTITSEFRVFADSTKLAGQQIPSDWTLTWEKRPEQGWAVKEIRATPVTFDPQAGRTQLPPK